MSTVCRVVTAQLMNNHRPLSDAVRARLRQLGNPYASLQLSDEDEGAVIHPSKSPQELTLELTQNPWTTPSAHESQDLALRRRLANDGDEFRRARISDELGGHELGRSKIVYRLQIQPRTAKQIRNPSAPRYQVQFRFH
jgi:hypothetical protein